MTDTLTLRVAGHDYTIPSPPARVGLAMQAARTISLARASDRPVPTYAVERAARYEDLAHSLDEDALGPAWGQMIDADVPTTALKRAALAAFLWVSAGISAEQAQAVADRGVDGLTDGGDPKASTSTGEDATTPTPDSTSGTTSPSRKRKRSDRAR